jgi:hypothetical protein
LRLQKSNTIKVKRIKKKKKPARAEGAGLPVAEGNGVLIRN